MKDKKIVKVIKFKAGYETREEIIPFPFDGWDAKHISGEEDKTEDIVSTLNKSFKETESIQMKSAYTPDGHYIGSPKNAYYLCKKRGIKPELADIKHSVCSIGFCEKEQKWYGWSHRAIFGFGIGDTVKEGDCCASSGWTEDYLKEHPEENKALPVGFIAKNLDDCKKMAISFAESVG